MITMYNMLRRPTIHKLMLAIATLAVALGPLSMMAHEEDIYDMSLDENLLSPEIKNDRQADKIQDFQYDMAVAFKQSNYEVEVMRDGEVIVITIPASLLFEPNDTVITPLGETQLKPFVRMVKNPGFYKMLLVMHSDNTGSSEYTLNLTRQRVNCIFDWFDENGNVDYVVPYALGETDPLVDNNSVENRKTNRRLEIFLVPEQTMLQQAKKGRINISQTGKN